MSRQFTTGLSILLLLLAFNLSIPQAYAQVGGEETIICPRCSEVNEATNRFCRDCGFYLPRPEPKRPPTIKELPQERVSVKDESVVQLSELTRDELIDLIIQLTGRTGRLQEADRDPNLVGNMTRAELEDLIRMLIREQIKPPKASGMGKFLQVIGGITLAIIGIAIIAI